jgi:BASS family bile acid:Na+ symporter
MTIDRFINLLAFVTLVELMFTIGLGATVAQVGTVLADWRGAIAAMLSNYVLVPAAALGLMLLFHPQPMVAAGVLIVAVCPGAPYGPPFTAIARGRVDRAVGLMVLLAGSSAVLAPLLLQLLLPLAGGGKAAGVDGLKIVRTLAVAQFIPLCAGLAFSTYWPERAKRLLPPCTTISKLLNLTLLVVILAAQFRLLAEIRPTGYLGMLALLIASAVAGWLLGGRDSANRKTLAITTAVRNVGVGLVIAGGSFPGTPAVTFVTAYALVQTLGTLLAVITVARRSPATPSLNAADDQASAAADNADDECLSPNVAPTAPVAAAAEAGATKVQ